MGVMRILDHSGDTQVCWEASDTAALEAARELFDRLGAEGRFAFARGPGVAEASRVAVFDPGAQEIIWVRAIQGG